MIKCEALIGRSYFKSYSEFYLALCMAAEMGRRGSKLDMSTMRVDKTMLSSFELDYFNYLKSTGCIYLDGVDTTSGNDIDSSCVKYYMDMENLTIMKDKMFEVKKDYYYWSTEVMGNYSPDSPMYFKRLNNVGNLLMHMCAYIIISEYLGEIEKKPFYVKFTGIEVKNTYYYINLYSCSNTMEWFSKFIILDTDLESGGIDVPYVIFCNNASVAGRTKHWTIDTKHDLMKKYGMDVGSIVILWTRGSMSASNIFGKITGATVARIDEIGDDFLGVQTIALNKTREEQVADYNSIDPGKQHLFTDMLNYKPAQFTKVLSLYEVGIDNYFKDEYMFITLLDTSEKVTKRVTINGKEADVEMSGIDAIYWLLCQYGIEFNRELYRRMYSDGKLLMWDEYGNDSSDYSVNNFSEDDYYEY